MVQMNAQDQAIIKAMPGNNKCRDCGMKSPTWASVSFGTLVCLECSGKHRGFGVHISFVRSVTMDSWTNAQLQLMKCGGNDKCTAYFKQNGISESMPIKEKYENPCSQHYKNILKARATGQPEPPPYKPGMSAMAPKRNMNATPAASVGKPGEDPNGMERLTGETDEQYIARQTRLREEARARMASKFGGKRGGMGGVGSGSMGGMGNRSGGRMQGIGSDSSYDPNRGYGGTGNDLTDSLAAGFGSAFSAIGAIGRTGLSYANEASRAGAGMAQQAMNDPNLGASVKSTGMSMWNNLSTAASDLAKTIAEPDADDGISSLRAHVQQEQVNRGPVSNSSVYQGFGSTPQPSSKSSTSKAKTGDDFFASFGA